MKWKYRQREKQKQNGSENDRDLFLKENDTNATTSSNEMCSKIGGNIEHCSAKEKEFL